MLNLYKYYVPPSGLQLYDTIYSKIEMLNDWDRNFTKPTEASLAPILNLIKKNPKYACLYARDIIKGRWKEIEPIILTSALYSARYAREILSKDPTWPYKSGRWIEAEDNIMKDPMVAMSYASGVLAYDPEWVNQPGHENGRWPEAETYILKDAMAAYFYAKVVIKGRWPEAEPIIKKVAEYWREYTDMINQNS